MGSPSLQIEGLPFFYGIAMKLNYLHSQHKDTFVYCFQKMPVSVRVLDDIFRNVEIPTGWKVEWGSFFQKLKNGIDHDNISR
jgi:hypothetical protein